MRIGPHEVHINDPTYVEKHFSSSEMLRKTRYEPYKDMFGMAQSTLNTVDTDLHKLRRGALLPFFSKRNIVNLEPMLHEKVEKVCSRLARARDTRNPIDLRLLFSCMTTDIITEYAFPNCFNLLDTPDLARSWRETFVKALRSFRWFRHFPSLWRVLRAITVRPVFVRSTGNGSASCRAFSAPALSLAPMVGRNDHRKTLPNGSHALLCS